MREEGRAAAEIAVVSRATPRALWLAVVSSAGIALAAASAWSGTRASTSTLLLGAGFLALVALTFADLRVGLGALAFAMVFSPEVGSVVYVRADDIIIAAVSLGWLGRQAAFREPLSANPLLTPMVLLAAAGVASFSFSTATGNVDPFTGERASFVLGGLHLVKRLEYLLIIFLVSQAIRTRREVQFFAALLILGAVLVAARSLPFIAASAGDPGFRIAAPFDTGEANTFGEYLMFVVALALGLALNVSGLRAKLALFAAIGICGFVFLYTFSRGSYIGLVAAVLILAVFKDARLLIPLAALAILLPARLPADVSVRVHTIPEEARTLETGDVGGNALLARVDSYRVAAKRLGERPLLGYGPGVVALERIESQYAREAIDGGLVGLAAFLLFLGRTWRTGRQVMLRRVGRLDSGIGLGYMAGVAGMAVAGLGAIPLTTIRTMEAFCFLSGLVAVVWRLQLEERSLPEELLEPEHAVDGEPAYAASDEVTVIYPQVETIDLREVEVPQPQEPKEEGPA